MQQTRLIMGMPITVCIVGSKVSLADLKPAFDYFVQVDNRFSTYKTDSEISRINRGEIHPKDYSESMREIFDLAKKTSEETNGYFNIGPIGHCDPSGIVKGWAINNAAQLLTSHGHRNFYIDAGGDIAAVGFNQAGNNWRVGIRNPFNLEQNVKVVGLSDMGIATSGNYERGEHIYNPKDSWKKVGAISSITVIGPNVYEADRFATAAFAMGEAGINLIESRAGLEGYMIKNDRQATMTTGFNKFVLKPVASR